MSSQLHVEASESSARRIPDFLIPPEYEPIVSLTESFGGQARKLWEESFVRKEEILADSEIVFTGIGGAPTENGKAPIKQYGDGSLIPVIVDLETKFGRVPKTLFLPASPVLAGDVIGLRGLARSYKEMGVEIVIPIITGLAHERQDRGFTASNGQDMRQVTTLKDVIETLAGNGYVDAGLITQPHSLRSVELGLRAGLPLLPLDAHKLLKEGAELGKISNAFVMGPDKGRKDDARILAKSLGLPMGSAVKTRDRLGNNAPVVEIDRDILEYIRSHKSHVIMFDDEIREAGTSFGMAYALDGYASNITICAVKGFFANVTGLPQTAIDYLKHPLITRIVVTDAVKPFNDVAPIYDKLEVLPLDPEIESIVRYLQLNPLRVDDPNWLRDSSQTGTLLRLDLSVEQVD